MSFKKQRKALDTLLNQYASEYIGDDEPYQWWWNGNDVLAVAIASLVRHLRKDGTAYYTESEVEGLRLLERYFSVFAKGSSPLVIRGLSRAENDWLHAEAIWLFGQWFERLWD